MNTGGNRSKHVQHFKASFNLLQQNSNNWLIFCRTACIYIYTIIHISHVYIYIYIYIYSSHVFLRYRGLNLWKDTLYIYIWFDAKRNNVFPLDCSFKPSEFGWFQVWTVSPGFVGEEHNHCYWFPHKQCHFMWMFPFFRPNLIDKTLLFAKTISNPCFDWLNPTPAFLLSSK